MFLLERLGLVQIMFYQWVDLMLIFFGTGHVLYYMLVTVKKLLGVFVSLGTIGVP